MEHGNNFLSEEKIIYPLKFLGITDSFSAIELDTVINTWLVIFMITILCLIARFFINKKDSMGAFVIREFVSNIYNLIEQTFGHFISKYYIFISSLFLFILLCNLISLIPYAEEPTKNINTTLALGITALLYMHKQIINIHGIKEYLREFFLPFNIIFPINLIAGLIMLPLKLLGELSGVVSISFRLFGNIFGGFVITSIYKSAIANSIILNLIGLITGFNFILVGFFILFEGFLQAFVFSILTMTHIAMATKYEHY